VEREPGTAQEVPLTKKKTQKEARTEESENVIFSFTDGGWSATE
jgi:hypothetical protein